MSSFGMVGKLTTGAAAVAVACVGVFAAAPAATAAPTAAAASVYPDEGRWHEPFIVHPQVVYGESLEARIGDIRSIRLVIENLSDTDFDAVEWKAADGLHHGTIGSIPAGGAVAFNLPYTVTVEDLARQLAQRQFELRSIADRGSVVTQQQFEATDQVVATTVPAKLTALANGKLVVAEHEGAGSLIANRSKAGLWEEFTVSYNDDNTVSLEAGANGKYVTAEDGGASALIANRTAIGPWEKFILISNADGTSSLKSVANGKYVTAEDGGASALIANRTAIGPWEKFAFTY